MKLKLWAISLLSVTAFAGEVSKAPSMPKAEHHAKKATATTLSIKAAQAEALEKIINEITNTANAEGSIGSPEELFKAINGEFQTNSRELPIQAAITSANAQKMRLTCYEEGSETVVASTDPTLLGKPVSDFQTSEGKSVRDRAIEEIRAHGVDDKAIFTYIQSGGPVVDGKSMGQGRAVAAAGRKAFKFNSAKKFLCTVAADADQ